MEKVNPELAGPILLLEDLQTKPRQHEPRVADKPSIPGWHIRIGTLFGHNSIKQSTIK